MWKRFGSGKLQQSAAACAIHRSPRCLSYKRQQTAAPARALQAGGRPFEPGTAHPAGVRFRRRPSPDPLADGDLANVV